MEIPLVEGKKWVEIEEAYTEKFGWYDGLDKLLNTKRDVVGSKWIHELTASEEYKLVQELRKRYNKGEPNANNENKNEKESSG